MLVIRNDGLGEIYPNDTDAGSFLKNNKNTHFAVKTEKGFVTNKNVFAERIKDCAVVKGLNSSVLLFEEDEDTGEYPFYLTGFYGINKNGKPITKIVTQSILTQSGNKFKIFRTPEMVKLLLVESQSNIGIDVVKCEAKIIGNMLRGVGLTAGLVISPTSVGILI